MLPHAHWTAASVWRAEGNKGVTMSACSQCGTVVKPGDKFCNVCGTPIRAGTSGSPAGPHYAAGGGLSPYASPSASPPPAYGPTPGGSSAPARCQLGHEISPGASYCAQGHPIALDQMQFAPDAYGAGYGPPAGLQPFPGPKAPSGAYPAPAQTYGPPPPAYNAPAAPQAAYAAAYGVPAPLPGAAPAPAYPVAPPPPAFGSAPQPLPPTFAAFQGDAGRDVAPAKVLRGFLVTYGSNPSGDFWPLTGGRLIVGRFGTGDGLDIALQDPTISSRHGAIVVDGAGSVSIEDTGSTNGTFVNDEHIGYGGRRELRDGDRIRFGGFTTVVKVIGRV